METPGLFVRILLATALACLAICQSEASSTASRRAACETASDAERHGLGCWRLRMRPGDAGQRQVRQVAAGAVTDAGTADARRRPIARDWERARARADRP
jgi:hypothetical protein